jgi:hypothetical protein
LTGEGEERIVIRDDGTGLLRAAGLLPLVRARLREEAAPGLEGVADSRRCSERLGSGVDAASTELEIFGRERDESPAERVERALSVFELKRTVSIGCVGAMLWRAG